MNKLTPEQLMLLNRKVTGEKDVVLQENFNELKRITNIPYQKNEELFYEFKTVVDKAAKLGNLIALQKPFVKGNKETAIVAMLTLLDINGRKVENYANDIDELCKYLEEPTEENIREWINSHLQ